MRIGIDLGGTKTEGILIDSTGKELTRQRIKTQKNYEGTIEGIKSIVNDSKSIESELKQREIVAQNIRAVLEGKEPINIVNREIFSLES